MRVYILLKWTKKTGILLILVIILWMIYYCNKWILVDKSLLTLKNLDNNEEPRKSFFEEKIFDDHLSQSVNGIFSDKFEMKENVDFNSGNFSTGIIE